MRLGEPVLAQDWLTRGLEPRSCTDLKNELAHGSKDILDVGGPASQAVSASRFSDPGSSCREQGPTPVGAIPGIHHH